MRSIALALVVVAIAGCASKPPVTTAPPPPTVSTILARPELLAQGGTISVTVRWNPYNAPANRLNVWLGKSSASYSLAATVAPSLTSTTVGGLKKNQNFWFKMTATSTNGLESGPSNIYIYNSKQ